MKQLAKSLISTALVSSALLSSAAMAEQKIGVVNVEGIFQQMPQTVNVQQTINTEFKDRQDEVVRLQEDIKYQLNKRQREAATMSEEQIKELEANILKMREEYNAKAQPLQQAMQARSAEERNKLLALIQQSIQTVAAEGDFDLILQGNAAVFSKPEFDLSEKVLEQVSKTQ